MRLLILTQKVDQNDDVLGFFYFWIKEFARHCQSIIVVALEVGNYEGLPENVKVLSLGKENKNSQLFKRLKYIFRFYKYIWQERKNYNAVFVHMNPEYIILGGLLWRVWGKKVALWYAHKSVNLKLRIAEKIVNIIFTSSQRGFRLFSKKVKIVGQGIRIQALKRQAVRKLSSRPSGVLAKRAEGFLKDREYDERQTLTLKGNDFRAGVFKIITVGRISLIKDYETLIKAIEQLANQESGIMNQGLLVEIIGKPITDEDKNYLAKLQKMIKQKDLERVIKFKGAVPNKEIMNYLSQADLFAHMGRTGSLDKAILEAMAAGLPVVSSNKAVLNDVLDKELKDKLGYPEGDAKAMAERIKEIMSLNPREREMLGRKLKDIVNREHSLEGLVKKIISIL